VANPPIHLDQEHGIYYDDEDRDIKTWLLWIDGHKGELSRLAPSGERVTLTLEACKK
jgi:hypothetical protein